MKIFFILILLLLSGCSSLSMNSLDTIGFDYSVNNSLEPKITKYILELNKKLNKDAFRFGKTIFGRKITISYTDDEKNYVAGAATASGDFCDVVIYPIAIKNNILKTVIWHELGHCVGLHHSGIIGEIMSEQAMQFKSYKKEQIKKFLKDFSEAAENL